MQKLHILHYNFVFTTAQIVINCTLKYALHHSNTGVEVHRLGYIAYLVLCLHVRVSEDCVVLIAYDTFMSETTVGEVWEK